MKTFKSIKLRHFTGLVVVIVSDGFGAEMRRGCRAVDLKRPPARRRREKVARHARLAGHLHSVAALVAPNGPAESCAA